MGCNWGQCGVCNERGEERTDLDDLVAGELERGDVHSVAGHEIAIENAQDRLVGDD